MAKKQLFEEEIFVKNNIRRLTDNKKQSNNKVKLANKKMK